MRRNMRRRAKGKTCKACGYWTENGRSCTWCGKRP